MLQKQKLPEGAAVIANFQTAGRGQHQNTWESTKGDNVLLSLYLKPSFVTKDISVISFLVSLAIRGVVQKLLPETEVRVKWPNDVMVGNKKIAGILVENRFSSAVESIIGIGLNVNQKLIKSNHKATSLLNEANKSFHVGQVLSECFTFVEKYYLLANKSGGVKQIWKLYVSQLYQLDEVIEVDGVFHTVCGVSPEGLLELNHNGVTRFIAHNEFKIKWN